MHEATKDVKNGKELLDRLQAAVQEATELAKAITEQLSMDGTTGHQAKWLLKMRGQLTGTLNNFNCDLVRILENQQPTGNISYHNI